MSRFRIDGYGNNPHGAFIAEGRRIGIGDIGEVKSIDTVLSRAPTGKRTRTIGFQDIHSLVVLQPGFRTADNVAAVDRHHQPDPPIEKVPHFDPVVVPLIASA